MRNLKIADYGWFHFTLTKKGFVTGFGLMATVVEIDTQYVMLRDNDGMEYMPRKADIDIFEREPVNVM